jgi:hypothetical protein
MTRLESDKFISVIYIQSFGSGETSSEQIRTV